jgi:hypothetical protein
MPPPRRGRIPAGLRKEWRAFQRWWRDVCTWQPPFGLRQPKQNKPERFPVDYFCWTSVGVALSLHVMMISTFGKRKNQTANARILGKTFSRREIQQYHFVIVFPAETRILQRGNCFRRPHRHQKNHLDPWATCSVQVRRPDEGDGTRRRPVNLPGTLLYFAVFAGSVGRATLHGSYPCFGVGIRSSAAL